MVRTIEISDTKDETIEQCKNEILDRCKEIIAEDPSLDAFGIIDALRYDGRDNEIVDSNTPIHYHEIDSWYSLYSSELEDAYNNAGIYNKQPDNYKQVCIHLYLEEQVNEWILEKMEELVEVVESFNEYNDKRLLENGVAEKMLSHIIKGIEI